jgi:hypothetical protein
MRKASQNAGTMQDWTHSHSQVRSEHPSQTLSLALPIQVIVLHMPPSCIATCVVCTALRAPFEHHPELIHSFATQFSLQLRFNCGDAVTFEHCDFLNLVHSFCSITCGGDFDHTKGGHLDLQQPKPTLEFPPNATIPATSGCLNHGNTPIQENKSRYSITQFAAGGLF